MKRGSIPDIIPRITATKITSIASAPVRIQKPARGNVFIGTLGMTGGGVPAVAVALAVVAPVKPAEVAPTAIGGGTIEAIGGIVVGAGSTTTFTGIVALGAAAVAPVTAVTPGAATTGVF